MINILLSVPMVRAIPERKTTRGFNKFCANVPEGFAVNYFVEELPGEWLAISDKEGGEFPSSFKPWIKCPYGTVGNRFYPSGVIKIVHKARKQPSDKQEEMKLLLACVYLKKSNESEVFLKMTPEQKAFFEYGQVPAVAATAFRVLLGRIQSGKVAVL